MLYEFVKQLILAGGNIKQILNFTILIIDIITWHICDWADKYLDYLKDISVILKGPRQQSIVD